MKSAIIAALIGSAAAFALAPVAKTSLAIRAFEDELGAQPLLGFFDPFGMLSGDVTQECFDRLRYVEIKHGRIAQLAFLGQIMTRAGLHLPGNINYAGDSFGSYPNGIAAPIGPNSIPFEGQGQIITFIGFLEVSFMRDVPETGNKHIGNFCNGYIDFGWDDLMRRPRSPNAPSSSTMAVPPCSASLDSWSTRKSSPLDTTRIFPSLATLSKLLAVME
jgi:hypothetical protein